MVWKMKARTALLNLVLILILFISLFLISSCKEEPECTKSSDCITSNPCFLGRCRNGRCVSTPKPNCCGNGQCESQAGENKCICPEDCGRCEGKVKFNVSTYRGLQEKEARYARFICEDKKCVVGVAPDDVTVLRLTDEIDVRGGFKADILVTVNNPFDTGRDKLSVEVALKDLDPDVVGGVTFTNIRVLSGNELLGRKLGVNKKLEDIGDIFTEEFELVSAQSLVEEEKSIDVELDYEYVVLERGEEVVKRSSRKIRLSKKIMLVVP